MQYVKENLKKFEICNIPKWHKAGYTGKNIKIATIESFNPNLSIFNNKVKNPYNYKTNSINVHGQKTTDVLHQVAFDSEIYILPSGFYSENGKAKGKFVEKTIPYIIKNNINFCCASLGGVNHDDYNKHVLKAQKHGTVFVASAGNEGDEGLGSYAKSDIWISVGAVGYSNRRNKITTPSYSSIGKELDFVSFSGLHVHDARDSSRTFAESGTSFSQPLFSGMCALVQQFFLENAGRTLYQDELYQFGKDNSIDLGDKGHDIQYGHGLFILPDPENIDVDKYLIHNNTNDKHKNINNKEDTQKQTSQQEEKSIKQQKIIMDTPSKIINGRFYIVARPFIEGLDGIVIWDKNQPNKGLFKLNNKNITLTNNSRAIVVNGIIKTMSDKAKIIDGRFYVPARGFIEALNGQVVWDESKPNYGIFKLNNRKIILKDNSKEMIIEYL